MVPLSQVSLIFACGTALFSDGYVNSVIGTVVTILQRKFGSSVITTNEHTTLNSIGFAGTIVGMITFGYLTDKFGRKFGMMSATGIIILFSFLSACSQGVHGSTHGLLIALIVFRFFLGIGIGAEYPCGSVAASEQSEEEQIAKYSQNRWLALATSEFEFRIVHMQPSYPILDTMIDFGFVIGSFVPLVLWWIFGDKHLNAVWRGTLGFGIIPSSVVFIWRLRMREPKRYREDGMKHAVIPYGLVIRRYWSSLAAISIVCLFASTILNSVEPAGVSFAAVLGWNTVINLFDMPGTILGAFAVDYLGPKKTLCWGLGIQGVVGFILAGTYPMLKNHVAGFAIMYGVFLSLGEFGPGNCTIILAAKTGPTAIRGHYYGIAAAVGKVGALVGTQALLSLIISILFVHPLSTDGMIEEDKAFREYLIENGYDVSKMGLQDEESDSVSSIKEYKEKEDFVTA
ncbi:hypothetical protein Clacol_002464 [Clathrus columnatus]|uniref:Major facilitator superfamily (MFS) profile domain-containing protein n=1 Tax=Clathrus columnatus TaxID=1419009 RepID=A0AAV5A4V8_9AGAM|nr:hypothetical protein Clacol_002464 [Clathrus columnatus]